MHDLGLLIGECYIVTMSKYLSIFIEQDEESTRSLSCQSENDQATPCAWTSMKDSRKFSYQRNMMEDALKYWGLNPGATFS